MPQNDLDVLIIGAGLSGIGAGCSLQLQCPNKRWAILEAREDLGGTWDLFRYPGIRSDSDMFTFGFSFRPWAGGRSYGGGADIQQYLRETAAAYGVDAKIRYQRRVTGMAWDSAAGRWTVEVQRGAEATPEVYTCAFLWVCAGYYRYDAGYTPDLPGIERFQGQVIHPQHWPEDLDCAGKRVVVIGSGATAVTLVPALAAQGAQVTMLQRSPTWVISQPGEDRLAKALKGKLPAQAIHGLTRWKNIAVGVASYAATRRYPDASRRFFLKELQAVLGDAEVQAHFTPTYNPWDQRVCLVPDADLFEAIKSGKAQVVTDHIDTFTEAGIALRSGAELPADLVVTATGLQLQWIGGASLRVDGQEVVPVERMLYRGAMLGDVPNAAVTIGYTNASWTLRAELTCELVCRTLNYMDQRGFTQCWPRQRDAPITDAPIIDLDAGYIRRAFNLLPRQGERSPWRVYQNYILDLLSTRLSSPKDGVLEFRRP